MSTVEARLRELRSTVSLASTTPAGNVVNIPDWWRSMSEQSRRNYLLRHPKSRLRKLEVKERLKDLSDDQKKAVIKFATKLSGPNGMLTKAANENLDPKKIKPKDKEKICTLLRAANGDSEALKKAVQEGERLRKLREGKGKAGTPAAPAEKPPVEEKPNGKNPKGKQKEFGYRAVALTLAACGLMVVGGAALMTAGVPLDCFTPELVKGVWQGLDLVKSNDELIAALTGAIKERLAKGHTPAELEDSLMLKNK